MRNLSAKSDMPFSQYIFLGIVGTSWKATSLADFWTRWNPYAHNAFIRFLFVIRRRYKKRWVIYPSIICFFLFMGILHDVGVDLLVERKVSFFFTIFFALNCFFVMLEKKLRLKLCFIPNWVKTILTFCFLYVIKEVAKYLNSLFF